MKQLMILCMVFVLTSFLVAAAGSEEKRNPAFETLKALEGVWIGSWDGTGKQVNATFRLISGGTSLMQTVGDFHGEMVTTFYPDGNHLMATHYCNANNQPRLRSDEAATGKKIAFSFHDATNMAGPDEGHIEKLVLTFEDSNHIRQDWSWRAGNETRTDTISLKRSK